MRRIYRLIVLTAGSAVLLLSMLLLGATKAQPQARPAPDRPELAYPS